MDSILRLEKAPLIPIGLHNNIIRQDKGGGEIYSLHISVNSSLYNHSIAIRYYVYLATES